MDLVGHAGLHRTQHADQALGDVISVGDLEGECFFVGPGRRQVLVGPSGGLDSCQGGLDEFRGLVQGVLLEVLHENPDMRQIGIHSGQVGDQAKSSAKNDAVPTTQNPYNVLLVLLDE